MSGNAAVVFVSLLSALAFATSTNLKYHSTLGSDALGSLSLRTVHALVRATVRHPLWLLGIAADGVGLVLQVTALHLGALAVVQPLLVSGLVFTFVIRGLHRRRLNARELVWAALLVMSLSSFLTVSGTAKATSRAGDVDRLPAVWAAGVGIGVGVSAIVLAQRIRHEAPAAALLGIAVGIDYAAAAALLKACTNHLSDGLLGIATTWQPYAVIAVGAVGLLLTQLAYRSGPLVASQPTIAAVDPLASVVIGVLVFDEPLRRGPGAGLLLGLALMLMTTAVLGLGRSEVEQA